MKQILLVAGAGALGALSRWGLTSVCRGVFGATFPYGTLAANVIGCLVLGFVAQSSLQTSFVPDAIKIPMTVGFLGALTTFSTFSYETVKLFTDQSWGLAIANLSANLFIGIAATAGGIAMARSLGS